MLPRHSLLLLATICAYSCGDGPSLPGSRPGIYVVAGGGVSDTVGAIQTQALIVEVYSARGIRAPAATTVQFASVDNEMAVGPLTGLAFGGFTTAALDADGRAAIMVRMGFKAGSARIELSVPTFDLIDTVNFIVTAGKAARIVISPSDTLLYFDVSYSVTGKVTDAHNNPRPDAVSWITPAGSPVTVSAAGVVTPGAAGRHSFTAASGSVTATAMVSALPRLKIVAYRYDPSPPAIVSMELDGSNLKVLTSATETGIGAHPAWVPGTNLVAFSSVTASNQVIRVVNEANAASPTALIATPPATMTHQVEPSPSNNGMWMYFSASDTRCGNAADYCVFRSTFNGSSVELLAAGFPSRQPAPSPDGSKVAFTRNDVYPATVRVLDIASGVVSSWSVAGQHAQWSPDGSMIAFWGDDARIKVINADGSGLRSITSAFAIYEGPISWSPDSRFIVARAVSPGVVDLIEVATGTAITLPNTGTLQAPQVK